MSKFGAVTPSINSTTSAADLRNAILSTARKIDTRLLVTPGVINTMSVITGNTDATETTLLNILFGVDTFTKLGSSLLTFAAGTIATNGNNKTLRLYWVTASGTTLITTVGPAAYNNIDWTWQFELIRYGGTTQSVWSQFLPNGSVPIVDVLNTIIDFSTIKGIRITGQGTLSADINLLYAKTQLLTT